MGFDCQHCLLLNLDSMMTKVLNVNSQFSCWIILDIRSKFSCCRTAIQSEESAPQHLSPQIASFCPILQIFLGSSPQHIALLYFSVIWNVKYSTGWWTPISVWGVRGRIWPFCSSLFLFGERLFGVLIFTFVCVCVSVSVALFIIHRKLEFLSFPPKLPPFQKSYWAEGICECPHSPAET